MHKVLDIEVVLNAKFNHSELLKLIKKGESIGVTYFDYVQGVRYLDSPQLKAHSAAEGLINKKYEYSSLLCKYWDTTFYLGFFKCNNNCIKLKLWGIGYEWKQNFIKSDGTTEIEFDTSRYVRLLLNITKEFKLNKLNAKIEWD